ncbi:hypothetical protein FO519_009511 [Halicephalobus sp. NKZ332]|nr:hypothetical protein FO519_009511 [Halicephalobus sp. NKZ332]
MRIESHTFNIFQLGLGFLLIFFAFGAQSAILQTIISTKHKEGIVDEHAGYASAAIIYGVFTFANFIAAPVVELLGARWALFVGALAYGIFQAGFLFLNEPCLYISSVLVGIGAAVLWTAQGKYLAINSTDETADLHTLLRMPKQKRLLVDTEGNSDPKMTFKKLVYSTFKLMVTKKMLFLALPFIYSGIEMSFASGIYATSISFTKKMATNTKTIMALNGIAQGLGRGTGGLLFGIIGKVTKKLKSTVIVFIGLVIHFLVFVAIYLNFPSDAPLEETEREGVIKPPSIAITLICGYLLGSGDTCWNTQIFSLLVLKYKNKSSEAFAVFKFYQSLATAIAFLYATHLNMEAHMLILAVTGILGFIGFAIGNKLPTQPEEANDNSSNYTY